MKECLLVLAVTIFLCALLRGDVQEESPEKVSSVLEQFLGEKSPTLREYRATRRMEASMSLGMKAVMEIETTLVNESELEYKIVYENGSRLVRDQLRALLTKEKEATRKNRYEKAAFSSENYVFRFQEESAGKWRFRAKPRKK